MTAIVAFAIGALFVAACGGDDDGSQADAADQAALDAVKEQATNAQILAAMTVFRVEGLHDLEDAIGEANEIDPNWQGKVTRMRRAVASVTWPDELKDKAAATQEHLEALETALIDEDLDGAKAAAPEAHDAYHELDSDAMPHIAGEEPGGEDDHGSEATTSGEAGH
jgi:hypothetical protein